MLDRATTLAPVNRSVMLDRGAGLTRTPLCARCVCALQCSGTGEYDCYA